MYFSPTEILQGLGVFFGAVGVSIYGMKKNGLITFGKPKERRSCAANCKDHDSLVDAVKRNSKFLKDNSEKLDKVDSKVDRILGHLGKL